MAEGQFRHGMRAPGACHDLNSLASALLVHSAAPRSLVGLQVLWQVTKMATDAARMKLSWRVSPGEAAAITSALQALMLRMRAEPGCTGCSLSTDITSCVEIRYVADWASESDLQRQIRSSNFTRLAELIEHATVPPVIEFTLPSGVQGLNYAELVRR